VHRRTEPEKNGRSEDANTRIESTHAMDPELAQYAIEQMA
jgi:hypothetical protein